MAGSAGPKEAKVGDDRRVFTPGDLVSLRRSLAMAPLSVRSQEDLITECERLTAERRQIAAVLAELPGPSASSGRR